MWWPAIGGVFIGLGGIEAMFLPHLGTQVMRTNPVVLPESATIGELRESRLHEPTPRGQHLYPVVSSGGRLKGVITRRELPSLVESGSPAATLGELSKTPVTVQAGDPLRVVVLRMAEKGLTRMPVVDQTGVVLGMISLNDLLRARIRNLHEEHRRERVLPHVRFRN
jgi:CBS domain-containing protein